MTIKLRFNFFTSRWCLRILLFFFFFPSCEQYLIRYKFIHLLFLLITNSERLSIINCVPENIFILPTPDFMHPAARNVDGENIYDKQMKIHDKAFVIRTLLLRRTLESRWQMIWIQAHIYLSFDLIHLLILLQDNRSICSPRPWRDSINSPRVALLCYILSFRSAWHFSRRDQWHQMSLASSTAAYTCKNSSDIFRWWGRKVFLRGKM